MKFDIVPYATPYNCLGESQKNEIFHVVLGSGSEDIRGSIDLFRQIFGIDLYTNFIAESNNNCGEFRFSQSYPYAILTPLMDGSADLSLRYLVLFSIFQDLANLDGLEVDESEYQVYANMQDLAEEVNVLAHLIYFIGFGANKLVLYDDFEYFVRYLATCNSGSNAQMIIFLVRNLCFSLFRILRFI